MLGIVRSAVPLNDPLASRLADLECDLIRVDNGMIVKVCLLEGVAESGLAIGGADERFPSTNARVVAKIRTVSSNNSSRAAYDLPKHIVLLLWVAPD